VICQGESVTLPDGSTVSAAGSYDVTLASVVTGCDSTITTNVTVNPLLFSTVNEVICQDESVTLPDGSTVNVAGSYDVTLSSVVTGCDSTITTNVTVNPLLFSTVNEVICQGESVTLPDGSTVSAAGSYDVTLASVVTGCDSTITTNVTVNPLLFSTVNEVICQGESVTLPDGSTVSAAGSYDVTLASVVTGCDSTITTNVTVNPLLFSTVNEVICQGESVTLPDGTSVSAAGSYDVTLASVVTGCDSTITTNVTVNPLLFSTVNEVICQDESVTLPDGSTVNVAGSYDVTLSSVVTGCDSTITTNVTVNPLLFSTVNEVICQDESVTLPDGSTVNVAGSYDVTLSSVVTGCDSTITTNVTVNPLLFSTVNEVICQGESVTLPDGSTVSAAGSYDVTLASVVTGCDSTITTNVTVNPLLFSTVTEVICQGESVTLPDGTSVSAAGSYDVTLASVVTGCDSTITTNVTVNPLLFSTVNEVICQDESVTLPDGSTVNVAGSYDVTLSVVTGCDSTITTNVTVNPLLFSTVNEVICQGESVTLPDGSTVSAAGSYDVTLASVVTGCDSTITTNVTVNPLLFSTVNEVICQDESVTLPDGSTVNVAGSYDVTLSSVVTGCDSTITTNVTVNPLLFSTVNEVICQGESVTLPDGSTVSAAGSYDVTLASVVTGCDSTITTNVTVNPLLFSTVNEVICQGESVTLPDGTSVSAAGSYDVTLSSVVTGCDSTITTNIIVNELITVSNITETCDTGGAFYAVTFDISGGDAGTYNVSGVAGIITSGNPSTFLSDPILEGTAYNLSVNDGNACNTINLNGNVSCSCPATASISGSTSVCPGQPVTITFTINGNGPFDVVYSDGSSSFTLNNIYDGHTITVNPIIPTTYTLVSMNDQSCSGSVSGSAIIVINPPLSSTTFADICQGQSVVLPDGTSVSAAGSYDVTLVSSFGCDSVVTTIVSINNILTSTTFVDICQGQSVILPDGTSVSAAGSYDVTLVSSFGCDSVVTTIVSINNILTSTTFVDICQGQSVILPDGTSVSAAGSYDVTLVSSFGCDSVVTTIVSINNILTSTTFVDICQGQSVILPDGTSVSAAGSYDVTLVSSFGCDSVVTTVVSILDVLTSTTFVDICQGQSVILPDGTSVSAAGSYDVTLVSSFGCDSVLTSTTFVDICQGQSVILPDGNHCCRF
jgi:hypothetical protein